MNRVLVRGVLLFSLLAVTGLAAKIKQPVEPSFPAIDANGNATLDGGGLGTGQLAVNTKNGKLVAKARGQTINESNSKQTFKNDPVVNQFYTGGPITISKSRLKVSASGGGQLAD